jgi:formylglycine-generating enzyme required for sulfatase activity/predicted amidohydrolase
MIILIPACSAPRGSPAEVAGKGRISSEGSLPEGGLLPLGVSMEPGRFTMGSPLDEPCRDDDESPREVAIDRAFTLSAHEVTQELFEQVMGYNPSFHHDCGGSCPVEWVTWHEAAAFCNRASVLSSLPPCYSCTGSGPSVTCEPAGSCTGFRLPTEAEWEYAARAGSGTAFPTGDISSCMTTDPKAEKIAWYKANSGGKTHPVGRKKPNAWGLWDMAGNVYEWTDDWYRPSSRTEKVFRGGAWYFNAEHARSASRERFDPNKRFTFLGFRWAITTSGPTELVAALQYASGQHHEVKGCSTDTCAIETLVSRAASKGAKLVVTPEYALDQTLPEEAPPIGEIPASGSLLGRFSKLARTEKIHLVINLQTTDDDGSHSRNSQVAFGPKGQVLAVHHKFELFAGESISLTPGHEVTMFDSPWGTVALLICADLYGDLRLHQALTTSNARLVAVSSFWTAPGAHHWQASFARNWGVYVVGANTTTGPGLGGGIFDPSGKALDLHLEDSPGIVLAPLPLSGSS